MKIKCKLIALKTVPAYDEVELSLKSVQSGHVAVLVVRTSLARALAIGDFYDVSISRHEENQ